MATEILFVGLNPVTVSMGLVFKEREIESRRVGFDPNRKQARAALDLEAVDDIVGNLRKSAQSADIVVLAVSMAEQRDYLELLGELLKPDAVILDTSPLKTAPLQWAQEFLPQDRYYIGLTPIVGHEALHPDSIVTPEPRPDLFQDGLVALLIPPNAPKAAMDLAINFSEILGASPFFVESAEHDAATALSRAMPWLVSAAIMRSASSSPGWREAQRLTGSLFALATGLGTQETPEIQGAALTQSSGFVLQKLDAVLDELHSLRNLIAEDDEESLKSYLETAATERSAWLAFRQRAEWRDQAAGGSSANEYSFFSSLFGFGSGRKKADH
jgi:prephenate dehydrogenase